MRRKSILDRENELSELLQRRELASLQTAERTDIDVQLKRAIRVLWQTRMLRDNRITVQDEIENNLAIFARTFLPGLPLVKRRLARLFKLDGEIMPYLRPGSWVGGDRDGNPNVSPETLDYAVRARPAVLHHYLGEIHALGGFVAVHLTLPAALKALAAGTISSAHQAMSRTAAPVTCYARMAATRTAAGAGRYGGRLLLSLCCASSLAPPSMLSPLHGKTMAMATRRRGGCSTWVRRWAPSAFIRHHGARQRYRTRRGQSLKTAGARTIIRPDETRAPPCASRPRPPCARLTDYSAETARELAIVDRWRGAIGEGAWRHVICA